MAKNYKSYSLRTSQSQAAAFEAVAAFRGESFNSAVISAMRALILETFAKEIEAGEDLLLRKMPEPLRLSDVCREFGIDFKEKK
ncbi:MAG: hypothetical protein HPY58_01590 [Firmicutes bacterium]|nr:hypothetical protein [Bacillota bacterium]